MMNIVINGGTRGIGKEVALCLAQDPNNLILVTGRNKQALKSLSAKHKNIHTLAIDLSVIDCHTELFRETVQSLYKRVDILLNVAGTIIVKDFLTMTNNEARLMMETNFFGPASLIRTLKPFMPSGSHIVNISSMGGFQ